MSDPKISIVMPVFNSGYWLGRALRSVRAQEYGNLELVVIDGGSTDETMNIIERNADIISFYKSEPDNGYADAFNKGVKWSSGDLVMMFAADDVLIPGCLQKIADSIRDDVDIWSGSDIRVDEMGYHLQQPNSDVSTIKRECTLRNTATLVRRNVYEEEGYLSIDYKCANDLEFLIRCFVNGRSFQIGTIPVVFFFAGGLSTSSRAAAYLPEENCRIDILYGMDEADALERKRNKVISLKRAQSRYRIKVTLARLGLLRPIYRLKREKWKCLTMPQILSLTGLSQSELECLLS